MAEMVLQKKRKERPSTCSSERFLAIPHLCRDFYVGGKKWSILSLFFLLHFSKKYSKVFKSICTANPKRKDDPYWRPRRF